MTFELYDWQRFVKRVQGSFRFMVCPSIFGEDRNVDNPHVRFLSALHRSSRERVKRIEKDTTFWRAQLGATRNPGQPLPEYCDALSNPFLGPYDRERMTPLPEKAREGRANPKGIPCLYVATEQLTAMSEVRPHVGSYISLAEFVTERDLQVVDLTGPPGAIFENDVPEELALERIAWADLNDAFSYPVSPTDDVADYAPTQIVAEVFRLAGYDGILYKSSVCDVGVNAALFEPACAVFRGTSLHRAKSLSFVFERQDEDRYYIQETETD